MTLDLSIGLNALWGSAALPQIETGADELLLAADRAIEVAELRELATAPATAGVVGDIAPPVVLDYGALPPEVNSGRMYAGPGAGSLLAAACAWDSLAAELHVTAAGYDSAISELTGIWWFGPAAESMVAAVLPFASWLSATASVAEQAGIQARAAAAAYEMAFALTVPPPVIASNRALLAALIATNWFGQNSAAIAATELHYAEMWAQDAGAMYEYAGSAAAAADQRSKRVGQAGRSNSKQFRNDGVEVQRQPGGQVQRGRATRATGFQCRSDDDADVAGTLDRTDELVHHRRGVRLRQRRLHSDCPVDIRIVGVEERRSRGRGRSRCRRHGWICRLLGRVGPIWRGPADCHRRFGLQGRADVGAADLARFVGSVDGVFGCQFGGRHDRAIGPDHRRTTAQPRSGGSQFRPPLRGPAPGNVPPPERRIAHRVHRERTHN